MFRRRRGRGNLQLRLNELLLLCFCALSVDKVCCYDSMCDNANTDRLPRSNTFVQGVGILKDGFKVNNNSAVERCTCVVTAVFGIATKIDYDDILQPSPLQRNCGSSICFSQSLSPTRVYNCYVNGTTNINVSHNIYITLEKDDPSSDTRYCFRVRIDQGDQLIISCNHIEVWNNTSTETERDPDPDDPTNMNVIIIGVLIGVFLAAAVVVIAIYLVVKSRKTKNQNTNYEDVQNGIGSQSQYDSLYRSEDTVMEISTVTNRYDSMNTTTNPEPETQSYLELCDPPEGLFSYL